MADRSPVLLVDAGGTLVTRTRPGLTTRVVHAVRRTEGDTAGSDADLRAAVLTAPDAESCLRALGLRSPAARAAVEAELADDPGDAVVLPGAEELLRTATALGWRVVVATNAGPGTPELPDGLSRHVARVVRSRDRGLVKEDTRFWTALLREEGIDPRTALVVGDHEVADRRAPASAGLQSRLVTADGVGLANLVADLAAAGAPPADRTAVVAGDREHWAARDIVPAPHLGELVTRVTRARVPFQAGDASGSCVVVRRRAAPPAVVGHRAELPGVAWLLPGRERSPYTVPAELATLLDHRGLSLDVLSPSDRRHVLSMIREARTGTTATERMADLVRFLERRGEDDDAL